MVISETSFIKDSILIPCMLNPDSVSMQDKLANNQIPLPSIVPATIPALDR